MSVRNIILLVVFAWVVLYFFIYYVLYSTTNVQSSEIIVGDSTRELKASGSTTGKSSIFSITQDPFTPSYCEELISSYSVTRAMASVIIPFRDGIKQDLLQTVSFHKL